MLALLIGVQVAIWMASGLYMTAISIDVIHGDHVTRHPVHAVTASGPWAPMPSGAAVDSVKLRALADGRDVYEIVDASGTRLVDAHTGAAIAPLDRAAAHRLAGALYSGEGRIQSVRWLDTTPEEVRGRPAPLWQVRFDDPIATTFYLSPTTHARVATRHDLWRAFDLLWMLHIMDYRTREDIGNPLLRVAALLAIVFLVAGAVLLRYTLRGARA